MRGLYTQKYSNQKILKEKKTYWSLELEQQNSKEYFDLFGIHDLVLRDVMKADTLSWNTD
jgi:hypothetical protein